MSGEAEEVLQVTVGVDGREEKRETSAWAGWGVAAAMGMLRCVSGGGRAATRAKTANIKRQRSEFMMLVLEIDMLVFNRMHVGGFIYTCIRGNSWIYARKPHFGGGGGEYKYIRWLLIVVRQRQLLASDRRSARSAGRKLVVVDD